MDEIGNQIGFGLGALVLAVCGCLVVVAIPFVLVTARLIGGNVRSALSDTFGLIRSPKPAEPEQPAGAQPDFRALAQQRSADFDALVAQKQSGRPTVTGQGFGAQNTPAPGTGFDALPPARPARDPFAQDNDLRRRTLDHPANPDDDMLGGMGDDIGI
jgi:hypothetical protein